jgi:hypothetical protein
LPPRETNGTYDADHPRILNGMLRRHATGCAWRDLPFPGAGAPVRTSVAGGAFPAWSSDGRELFYLTPGGDLMTVAVAGGASLDLAAPRLLVRGLVRPASARDVPVATYAPMPNGQRFLVRDTRRGDPPLTLVAPWTAALRTSTP